MPVPECRKYFRSCSQRKWPSCTCSPDFICSSNTKPSCRKCLSCIPQRPTRKRVIPMPDMLVKLYDLPEVQSSLDKLKQNGIVIKRAMTADKHRIVSFVGEHFTDNWRNECECTFASLPV